jgi:hypothetical protein
MLIWLKRILLTLPFAVAAGLTAILAFGPSFPMRREHVAGYAFLFGSPWAWLLDHNWLGSSHSAGLEHFITYMVILWVPALLYAACLWLVLRGIAYVSTRGSDANG